MILLRRLYSGRANFDFVAGWKRGAVISAVLFLVAVGSLLGRGLELGIDFEGGGVWEVPAETASIESARDALRPLGLANARIQEVTDGTGDRLLRVRAGVDSIDDSPRSRSRWPTSRASQRTRSTSRPWVPRGATRSPRKRATP